MKFPKPISVKKEPKPLRSVGKRTKERLALYGSETAVHEQIWSERAHVCEICGDPIMEPLVWCFAHKLPKGMFKAYRYMPENYALVCDITCHQAVDRLYQGEKRADLIKELDDILSSRLRGLTPTHAWLDESI